MSDQVSFHIDRYILTTVDPVHVGTGGNRLGRVDNSIIREPGTRLPKIPGTSLSGALRHYTAYRKGTPECAGQKSECQNPRTCPVCYTFGTASEAGEAYSGVVSIGDARLLLFPVYSMEGPVWVTAASVLRDVGVVFEGQEPTGTNALFSAGIRSGSINLTWVMVSRQAALEVDLSGLGISAQVADRVVLVSETLFSQVVNSGLEVRTSVAINPETGAAEDKALFTYEAIPRAAFLWTDVVVDDFRGGFPSNNPQNWGSPAEVIQAGFEWAAHLGVGGMGTRGFGRISAVSRNGMEVAS